MSREVYLVNPAKRRRRKSKSASRRSRRRNPVRTLTSARRRGGRGFGRTVARTARRRSPAKSYRRRVMRRRSNPIRMGNVLGDLMPAFQGAGGAILTETAFRFVPAPGALAILKGTLAPVTKIGIAYGIGVLVNTFGGRRMGVNFLNGALTVIAYDFLNQQVLSRLPMVGVGGDMSAYMNDSLGYHSAGAVMPALPDAGYSDSGVDAYMEEGAVGAYLS